MSNEPVMEQTCEAKHEGVTVSLKTMQKDIDGLKKDVKDIKDIVTTLSGAQKKADVFDKIVWLVVGAVVGGYIKNLFLG